ncbi:hypothetical protein NL676_019625 [Syzygium grande]|nr:hypothetical protein NL676_019625 [Syzygium grande]
MPLHQKPLPGKLGLRCAVRQPPSTVLFSFLTACGDELGCATVCRSLSNHALLLPPSSLLCPSRRRCFSGEPPLLSSFAS